MYGEPCVEYSRTGSCGGLTIFRMDTKTHMGGAICMKAGLAPFTDSRR